MTTKEYLNQISRLDKSIKNKISELDQLRELTRGLKAQSTEERVQTTPNHDKIGTAIAKIEEMENQINTMIDNYVDKKREIVREIESMENECHYDVLFERYIQKNSFDVISQNLNYSTRQITRIHGNALVEFEKKYGQKYMKMS